MNDVVSTRTQAPAYVKNVKKIDALLWTLAGLTVALAIWPGAATGIRRMITVVTLVALIWIFLIMRWRITRLRSEKWVYRRLTPGDCLRLFVVLWLGYGNIASISPTSFILISIVVVPLFFVVIAIGLIAIFVEEEPSVLVVTSIAVSYLLFSWQKKAFVTHHGVPIIGHFLEKPNFDARYYVKVSAPDSMMEQTLLADIRVESYPETDDIGDQDRFGDGGFETYEVKKIWIKQLQFPNGSWVGIDPDSEPATLEGGGFVKDQHGRHWHVQITRQKAD